MKLSILLPWVLSVLLGFSTTLAFDFNDFFGSGGGANGGGGGGGSHSPDGNDESPNPGK